MTHAITFPDESRWAEGCEANDMGLVICFPIRVNGKQVRCAIALEAIVVHPAWKDPKYGVRKQTPEAFMDRAKEFFEENRSIIVKAARRGVRREFDDSMKEVLITSLLPV